MKLSELAAKKAEVDAMMKEHGKAAIVTELSAFFDKHPSIGIAWRQYTPYFNDGDACTFSLHGVEVIPPGDEHEWYEHEVYSLKRRSESTDCPPWLTPELAKDASELESLLNHNEDALLMAFGDHVEVIARKDGVAVDECSHD